jgi:hypothetical protein
MTIWAAHLERHPLNEFYAVPSYLLRLDDGARWVVVWGDHLLLVLAYIEIDGIPVRSEDFFGPFGSASDWTWKPTLSDSSGDWRN